MANETIVTLKLRGVKEAEQDMERLSEEITKQKLIQRELKKEIRELEKAIEAEGGATKETLEDLAAKNLELEKSKKVTSENTTLLRQNIRVLNAEEESLDQKRASLNLLQKEYGQINQSTDEGKRKAAQYREEIEQLTLAVKAEEKAIGDTRRNVGNYTDSIVEALGILGPFGDKIAGMITTLGSTSSTLGNVTEGYASMSTATEVTTKTTKALTKATETATEVQVASQAASGTFAQTMRGVGNAIKGATKQALKFIATPIGAAIAALAAIVLATKEWAEFNAELRKTKGEIAGITDLTGPELDQVTAKATALNDALGLSIKETTSAAKVLVQQFGIDYNEALDEVQTGILATNGANEELLDSVKEYSTFFADAGFSVKEFTGIINAGFDLGIYSDKLPDAIKEADISLREGTKATREALENAFGASFSTSILARVDAGAISTREALDEIAQQAEKTGLSAEQYATLTADVFRGAGEDVGGAAKIFEALQVGISGSTNELDEYGQETQKVIEQKEKLAKKRQEAFESEGFQKFVNFMRELGTTILVGVVEVLGFVAEAVEAIVSFIPDLLGGTASLLQNLGDFFDGDPNAFNKQGKDVGKAWVTGVSVEVDNQLKKIKKNVNDSLKIDQAEFAIIKSTFEDGLSELENLAGIAGEGAGAEFSGNFEEEVGKAFEKSQSLLQFQFEVEAEYLGRQEQKIQQALLETERLITEEYEKQNAAEIENQRSMALSLQMQANVAAQARGLNTVMDDLPESFDDHTRGLNQIADITGEMEKTLESNVAYAVSTNEEYIALEKELENIQKQQETATANLERQTELAEIYRDMAIEGADKVNKVSKETGRSDREAERIQREIIKLGLTRREQLEFERTSAIVRLGLMQKEGESYEDYVNRIGPLGEKAIAALNHIYQKGIDQIEEEEKDNLKRFEQDAFEAARSRVNRVKSLELLLLEEAQLKELELFDKGEDAKDALLEEHARKRIRLEQKMIEDQISVLEEQLAKPDLNQFFDNAQIEQLEIDLQTLKNALIGLNIEYNNVGKDEDGNEKTIEEFLGVTEEDMAEVQFRLTATAMSLDALSDAIQAAQIGRMQAVDQQVKEGIITEERATKKKEQIQREFARKQKAIDLGNALINTALAVTAALGAKPFGPQNFVMAALAGAQGLAQASVIAAQKFAKGGILHGPSHAQGGIPMFSKGGAFYGEAEGGEAILTKGVMKNPALAQMASAINVAGGGVPLFEGGGVLQPIQAANPADRAADLIAASIQAQQPVLVVEQLNDRQQRVNAIESLSTIG